MLENLTPEPCQLLAEEQFSKLTPAELELTISGIPC
jgi:hypothetical protein